MSSVDFLRRHYPGSTEQEYRAHLGRFGLSGDLGLNEISTLSGGQKSRLVFAWMAFTNPHLMVLDEPENHLDVDTGAHFLLLFFLLFFSFSSLSQWTRWRWR